MRLDIGLKILGTVFACVAAIGIVASVYQYVPLWFIYLVIIVVASVVCWTAYPSLSGSVKQLKLRRRHNRLAKKRHRSFRTLVSELNDFTDPQRVTIAVKIQELIRGRDTGEYRYYDLPLARFHEVVGSFTDSVDNFEGTATHFSHLAQQFEALVLLFHCEFVNRPAQLLRTMLKEKTLTQYERDEYTKLRDLHCKFMEDCIDFAKTVNSEFGEQIRRLTYYEPTIQL